MKRSLLILLLAAANAFAADAPTSVKRGEDCSGLSTDMDKWR